MKKNVSERSRIADPILAASGHAAIDWAGRFSPVLNGAVRDRLGTSDLAGKRIAVVIHLEAKTAFLATVLADAGAEVIAAGSNPHSTRDDVCAALVERGIEVHASRASSAERWEQDLLAVADTEPDFVVDDGAELTMRMMKSRPALYGRLQGVSEETTTGVARLRRLESAGRLPMPAMAANDAACKHLFDNRYGTGQSTMQAILALTNVRMSGLVVAIVGYGWVGRGIATYVRQMGARALVIEVDPIRALEAHMDGNEVLNASDALGRAEVVITATGGVRAIGTAHFDALAPGVILANAGHHDLEIDVPALQAAATQARELRDGVMQYTVNGKSINVLAGGALVNIAGGLGHPIQIMDLSFSVQALACHEVITGDYRPGVHTLPHELDQMIARAKLESLGVAIDHVTADQADPIDDLLESV